MMAGFHPLVSRWFLEAIGEPTQAQLRGWDAIRSGRHTLIAAPTGSGKTLAAFLTTIDDLVREGSESPLPDAVRVVYVSPLKALSADIHKNLAEPRRALRRLAETIGRMKAYPLTESPLCDPGPALTPRSTALTPRSTACASTRNHGPDREPHHDSLVLCAGTLTSI
jgi:Rad3-related DNA helicase